jgi:hypothetical protein
MFADPAPAALAKSTHPSSPGAEPRTGALTVEEKPLVGYILVANRSASSLSSVCSAAPLSRRRRCAKPFAAAVEQRPVEGTRVKPRAGSFRPSTPLAERLEPDTTRIT